MGALKKIRIKGPCLSQWLPHPPSFSCWEPRHHRGLFQRPPSHVQSPLPKHLYLLSHIASVSLSFNSNHRPLPSSDYNHLSPRNIASLPLVSPPWSAGVVSLNGHSQHIISLTSPQWPQMVSFKNPSAFPGIQTLWDPAFSYFPA